MFFAQCKVRFSTSFHSPTALSKIREGVGGREGGQFKMLVSIFSKSGITILLLRLMKGKLFLNILLLPRRGASRKDHRDEHWDENRDKDAFHVGGGSFRH
jgi:hypothetical protein